MLEKLLSALFLNRASRFVVGVDSDIVDSDILEALKQKELLSKAGIRFV